VLQNSQKVRKKQIKNNTIYKDMQRIKCRAVKAFIYNGANARFNFFNACINVFIKASLYC